jgi:hypothetical protein
VVSHVTAVLWLRAFVRPHCAVSFSFFYSPRTHLNLNKLHLTRSTSSLLSPFHSLYHPYLNHHRRKLFLLTRAMSDHLSIGCWKDYM